MNTDFWKGRNVFITGHTGFKGGWISLWLSRLGANVYGYSLPPPTQINFFELTNLKNVIAHSTIQNILDLNSLKRAMKSANPSLVIHMAAQSLVLKSYESPIETFNTNIIGTVNVLEASSYCKSVKAIINVTSDKCYENLEKVTAYNESDNLGGHDPYSSSKACSELISAAYRNSFLKDSGINLATVRAGNVIGGGDWAKDRLIPDFFRALNKKELLQLRYPKAIRPWQHVLEPISGYLMLAQKLLEGNAQYSDAWNFGPDEKNMSSVSDIIDYLSTKIKHIEKNNFNKSQLHETNLLKIDSSKARSKLGWSNKWNLKMTLDKTIQWYQAWQKHEDLITLTISQIDEYQNKLVK